MILKEIQESDFIKIGKLFSSPIGKEVLGILDRHFYNTISYQHGQPDTTAFMEGHRDMVHIFHAAVLVAAKETKHE